MKEETRRPVEATDIDGIPAIWIEPDRDTMPRRLAIVLPGLTGTKEIMEPYLHDLAGAGLVALAYDPWQHGVRGTESREEIGARVFGSFRRFMWPILGQTTLDALRVIDWAIDRLAVVPQVRICGTSMGGDISIAVAGIDPRVERAAAMIATPDWLRPGMRNLRQLNALLPQGEAENYAQFFYDHLNPLTHLAAYAHLPELSFECGAADMHVPPDGALRFESALRTMYPEYGDRLRVTLHAGVGHEIVGAMWQNCLDWLAR